MQPDRQTDRRARRRAPRSPLVRCGSPDRRWRIALLIGGVWIGQGLNIIPGSAISGDDTWFYVGIVVAVIGVILLVLGVRRSPHRRN